MTRRCKDCKDKSDALYDELAQIINCKTGTIAVLVEENKRLKVKLEKIKKSLHTCSIRCKKCSIQNFCQTYKIRKIIEGAEDE